MSLNILKVEKDNQGLRIDVFLTKVLPDVPSRNFIKKLIKSNNVLVNDKIIKSNYLINEGDSISCKIPEDLLIDNTFKPEKIDLDIIYEDQWLMVVNKPAGMLVHPTVSTNTGTLVNALLYHCEKLSDSNTKLRPGIVHRLDRETSGLLVIAKDNKIHTNLAAQFKNRTISKKYVAVVHGILDFDEGCIDAPLGRHNKWHDLRQVRFDDKNSKKALTYYKVKKRIVSKNASLVELSPKTGRTHQLRVHMAYIKHPILGDGKYGNDKNSEFPRLALHSMHLGFHHLGLNERKEFSIAMPQEFELISSS